MPRATYHGDSYMVDEQWKINSAGPLFNLGWVGGFYLWGQVIVAGPSNNIQLSINATALCGSDMPKLG